MDVRQLSFETRPKSWVDDQEHQRTASSSRSTLVAPPKSCEYEEDTNRPRGSHMNAKCVKQ
jgi:hypothetical protein